MRRSLKFPLYGLVLSSLGVTLGCGSDTTGPAPMSAARQYWALTLNHHAITLATIAPYDTIQLVATPRTVTGAPLATSTRPIFTSSDTSIKIDSTGLVTVHTTATKSSITVIAKLTIGGLTGLTLADTAKIDVVQQTSVATTPVLTTFAFQPVAGDSAIYSADESFQQTTSTKTLSTVVLNATSTAIPGTTYTVHYASADTTIATITTAGVVTPHRVGHVLLTAETAIYGVYRTDSLQFTVGWPLSAYIYIDPQPLVGHDSTVGVFNPNDDTVGIGAIVSWYSLFPIGGQIVDVTFDDTSLAQGYALVGTHVVNKQTVSFNYSSGTGNIAQVAVADTIDSLIVPGTFCNTRCTTFSFYSNRFFPQAGTVSYHSTLYGTTGVIHVLSNASVP